MRKEEGNQERAAGRPELLRRQEGRKEEIEQTRAASGEKASSARSAIAQRRLNTLKNNK